MCCGSKGFFFKTPCFLTGHRFISQGGRDKRRDGSGVFEFRA